MVQRPHVPSPRYTIHNWTTLCRNGQDGCVSGPGMERIRQRLVDESARIAKSEARRREREGKKIGKQVQLEKLK